VIRSAHDALPDAEPEAEPHLDEGTREEAPPADPPKPVFRAVSREEWLAKNTRYIR
jgi:hypothetical protein